MLSAVFASYTDMVTIDDDKRRLLFVAQLKRHSLSIGLCRILLSHNETYSAIDVAERPKSVQSGIHPAPRFAFTIKKTALS